MPTRIPPSIGAEADRLETAINQARLSLDQEIGVWSVYGDHGLAPALHVLTAHKEAKSPVLMRQKAAPAGDEFDQLGQQIADAARQMAMQAGGDRKTIIDQLRSYAMQLAAPQRATKTAKVDPLIAAIQSGGNWDGR